MMIRIIDQVTKYIPPEILEKSSHIIFSPIYFILLSLIK